MKVDVTVFFWDTINPDTWYTFVLKIYRMILSIGSRDRIAKYTHCAVVLKIHDTGKEVMYHVGGNVLSRWTSTRILKTFPPMKAIELGTVDVDTLELRSVGPIRFQLWVYFFWYVILRHFTKWEPKNNCSTKTAEILELLGYENILYTCVPVWLCDSLEKGVTHANNNDSGESRSR